MTKQIIAESISVDRAVKIIKDCLGPDRLNNLQDAILRQAYLGKTYEEIADESGYSIQHIRDVGYKLWQCFSEVLGEKVTKSNLQTLLRQKIPQLESKATELISINDSFPEGPVSLNSPFYIERSLNQASISVEERAYNAIIQPGALIRIKAPRQMGKTSLTMRIIARGASLGYHTARINFSQAEGAVLNNLAKFLRWFCANVTKQLKLRSQIDDYWDEDLGSKVSCSAYFQGYILQQLQRPLILALDEVDRLFEFPDIATEFLPLLRFWHEEANNLAIWQQLRLIVVHSTEAYIPLNIDRSPFNVGLPLKLPEFDRKQIETLARLYSCNFLAENQISSLIAMVGGHPYLIRLALYYLASENLALEELLQAAPTASGIYSSYLRRHLANLKDNLELATALKQVVNSKNGVELESILAYKLASMGLIKLVQNRAFSSCKLYSLYFRSQL